MGMADDAPTTSLWGGLRILQPRRVSGWAFAPRLPEEHLRIELRIDGAVVATEVACQNAAYLAQSGVCAADHGFSIATEERLPVEAPERIEVTAIGSTGERLRLALPDAGVGTRLREQRAVAPITWPAPAYQARPVFVLGAHRSGTSVVGRGLRKSGRYGGYGEGHLLPLLPALIATVRAYYEAEAKAAAAGQFTQLASVSAGVVEEGLASVFGTVAQAQFPAGDWMDKTPGAAMIRAAPLLAQLWPGAKFVFVQRRAIENVASRLRKFPQIAFETHCAEWRDAMAASRDARLRLGEAAITIDWIDLVQVPEKVMAILAPFAGLDLAQAERMLRVLRQDRPQQSCEAFGQVLSLADVPWVAPQRASFILLCGEEMQQAGYTLEVGYRSSSGVPRKGTFIYNESTSSGEIEL
jgi:hypothetical protein